MHELPILMNGAMVRAVLEGRKTVTRRLVKLRHPWEIEETDAGSKWPWHPDYVTGGEWDGWVRCPYGQPGDRLYVRETFALEAGLPDEQPPFDDGRPTTKRPEDDVDCVHPAWEQAHYRASDPAPDLCCFEEHCVQCRDNDMGPHWKPAIHMPKAWARIWLEVTAVRVERLQELTAEQAIAEGMTTNLREGDAVAHLRYQFGELWDGLAKPGMRWADNPWVWVVEFRRIEVQP